MANQVDVIFNGIDKLSGVINRIMSANDASVKSLFSAVGGWDAVGKAAQAAARFIEDSIVVTMDYSETVRAMSRITGESAEETSRLIQVTDDLMISQGELETAMRGAVIKGVDTSIEGMMRLSDEYLKLDEGLERSNFLTDKFGRSGLAMGAMMEKGGDAIRGMADEIDAALVLTEDDIKATKELKEAQDELNDAFLGVKTTIGRELIPELRDLTKATADYMKTAGDFEKAETGMQGYYQNFEIAVKSTAKTVEDAYAEITEAIEEEVARQDKALGINVEALNEHKKAVKEFAAALNETITKQMGKAVDVTMDMMDANEEYKDKIHELTVEHWELLASKQALIDEGYSEESEELIELTGKIDDNAQAYYDLIDATREQRKEMVFNILTEGLDAAAKLEVARTMGLIDEGTYTLYESLLTQKSGFDGSKESAHEMGLAGLETVESMDAIITKTPEFKLTQDEIVTAQRAGRDMALEESKGINGVYEAMQKLDGERAEIYINTVYTQSEARDDMTDLMRGNDYASGGSFTVPPGYPNDSYPMWVESGERVSVTPANEVGAGRSGGSGGINVYLQYSPVVSMADRYEAETKLVPYIESALRKIR